MKYYDNTLMKNRKFGYHTDVIISFLIIVRNLTFNVNLSNQQNITEKPLCICVLAQNE